MAPLFSVLLPTHYRPDTIGIAIRSVLAQTETDFELLVVGDGAVAGTAEVVLGFDDPRIRWFDLPKAPSYGYANRNIAMAEARGSLAAHMSDDDVMLPDHLALMRQTFETPAVQWAYSQVLWVSTDGIAAPDLTNLGIAEEREVFAKENTISGTVFAYRRSAFDTVRPWPEEMLSSADWRMMKRLLRVHGPDALARVGVPTLLHFPAGKKNERRDSYFAQLAAWLEMADAAPWWPAALRSRPAPGQLHQEWYLNRLQGEPGFLAELRRGVDTIVARAALERLAPRFRQAAAERTAALQQSLAAAEAEVRELRGQVARLEGRASKLSEELAFRDMLLGPDAP